MGSYCMEVGSYKVWALRGGFYWRRALVRGGMGSYWRWTLAIDQGMTCSKMAKLL